ncbi:glutaredoxin family protein [Sorangium sp. So ce542]|uniref:glutaredoxin family protein n=1 Tax=Sorangium sp. So ce542 TaxID=3133316 RepID=UPI003F635CC3
MELFTRKGCPRCDEAERFVAELEGRRPGLRTLVADIVEDRAALDRLRAIAEAQSTAAVSVPAFYVRGVLVVGYAGPDVTGRRVEALLDSAPPPPAEAGEPDASCPLAPEQPPCPAGGAAPPGVVDVPVLGRLEARDLGLPAFTVLLGLVDGFNPCATWVLLFLRSSLATLRSRAKMLLIAGVFVLVSGLAYFAVMARRHGCLAELLSPRRRLTCRADRAGSDRHARRLDPHQGQEGEGGTVARAAERRDHGAARPAPAAQARLAGDVTAEAASASIRALLAGADVEPPAAVAVDIGRKVALQNAQMVDHAVDTTRLWDGLQHCTRMEGPSSFSREQGQAAKEFYTQLATSRSTGRACREART